MQVSSRPLHLHSQWDYECNTGSSQLMVWWQSCGLRGWTSVSFPGETVRAVTARVLVVVLCVREGMGQVNSHAECAQERKTCKTHNVWERQPQHWVNFIRSGGYSTYLSYPAVERKEISCSSVQERWLYILFLYIVFSLAGFFPANLIVPFTSCCKMTYFWA